VPASYISTTRRLWQMRKNGQENRKTAIKSDALWQSDPSEQFWNGRERRGLGTKGSDDARTPCMAAFLSAGAQSRGTVPKRKTAKKTVGYRPWGYLFHRGFADFARK
jgi:hypothetical protein